MLLNVNFLNKIIKKFIFFIFFIFLINFKSNSISDFINENEEPVILKAVVNNVLLE